MAYITPDAQEEKLLEYPELFNTPSSAMARRPLWATARTSGPNGSKIFPEGDTAMWDNTLPKKPISPLLCTDGPSLRAA